jgi:hypothetical protein
MLIVSRRAAILAMPNGKTVYTWLQTALALFIVAFLCWQFFAIGFQSGGDIARRDARAEARAAPTA